MRFCYDFHCDSIQIQIIFNSIHKKCYPEIYRKIHFTKRSTCIDISIYIIQYDNNNITIAHASCMLEKKRLIASLFIDAKFTHFRSYTPATF